MRDRSSEYPEKDPVVGFDDLFGADEKSDYDSAVNAAKERLIVGDSEQSVLARLQSEGWNVKQSKFILGHAKS